MTEERDDIFKPKLGRMRGAGGARARSYLNRVLKQLSAAGKSGFGARSTSRRFSGSRIGRGRDTLRHWHAGHRVGPSYRRVVIKSRIVKLKPGGLDAARAHLRYIQRDGVSKEHEPGRLYDAASDDADGKAFLERSEGDRHQFRFIVSPEDATELGNLKPFIRDLMGTMEKDLDTRLDWIAVDHFNTGHPHTHIVLRGKDEHGKDLVIARDYIAYGMRRQASELLTLELGPQTEQEIRQKLDQQVEQERFTDIDRQLLRRVEDGILDMRAPSGRADARYRQTVELGRLRVLERRGLAEETAPGRWQLSGSLEETLRRAGERGDIIKAMHRGLTQAGLDAATSELSIHDAGDPRAKEIVGRVVDRGLHDELSDSPYIIVDAADGRIHYVALDPWQDMDDVPVGSVVSVTRGAPGLKPSDQTIARVARQNSGLYSADAHRALDPRASAEFVKAHVRRLEALRRQNIAQRFPDGSWEIPDDFEDRVAASSKSLARTSRRLVSLSFLSLEAQVTAEGATWLDRQLLAREPVALRGERFGGEAAAALRRRREHLIELDLAERDGENVRYRRNLLRLLQRRELIAAGEKLARETGLSFAETRDGDRIDGIYRQPVRLASDKFALIEKSKEFTLVPWRPVLERQRGKVVGGVLRGSSVSFEFSRKRGIGSVSA